MLKELLIFVGGLVTGVAVSSIIDEEEECKWLTYTPEPVDPE